MRALFWIRGFVLACAVVLAVSAGAARAAAVPLGSALWFACTQQTFDGPPPLRCPMPYDPRYESTFLRSFDRFTPENEFKMMYLEPRQNRFDFSLADQVAEFAQIHGKTIRGHTLVYNDQLPWWFSHPLLPFSHAVVAELMRSYISTVVGHFATLFPGVVTEWDVVNEPLAQNGALAPSPWLTGIGPGYIATALELAHTADPKARLLINENDAEMPGPKAEGLLALATNLKRAGVPLDAVGFEAHVTTGTAPRLGELVSLWRRYAQVGLDVEVTELDVDDDGVYDPGATLDVYRRYAEACRIVGNCVGFTVWGVANQYSWLGPSSDALMFNNNFQPTPAFELVRNLLGARVAKHRTRLGFRHGLRTRTRTARP